MLPKDFREFIELLNSESVEYVVVGGYAVAYHGHPRYTGDIDFFVEASEDNAHRILNALRRFGFASLALTEADFVKRDQVVQLGIPPQRIDLLTGISGVSFSEAWENRVSAALDGVPVYIIGREMLLKNKAAAGRPQDEADLREIPRGAADGDSSVGPGRPTS